MLRPEILPGLTVQLVDDDVISMSSPIAAADVPGHEQVSRSVPDHVGQGHVVAVIRGIPERPDRLSGVAIQLAND